MMKTTATKVKMSFGTVPNIENSLFEMEKNTVASEFITDNYEQLVKSALKMGVDPEKANDIVHDVFVSILKSEDNGFGYDISKGNKSDVISVEHFVFGRLKLYSKNVKYRKSNLNDHEICSSSSSTELDTMNFAQRAYETASSYDEIEKIDASLSIAEEIEYLISFESQLGLNIRFFLSNIKEIANQEVDNSVFCGFKKLIQNADAKEALASVFSFSRQYPDQFTAIIANI